MKRMFLVLQFLCAYFVARSQADLVKLSGLYTHELNRIGNVTWSLLKPNGTFQYNHEINSVRNPRTYLAQGNWEIRGDSIVMNSIVDTSIDDKRVLIFNNETWRVKKAKLIDYTPIDGTLIPFQPKIKGQKKYVYRRGIFTQYLVKYGVLK